eukprot:COSAG01_NODE_4159_length_5281_cov_23.903816_4_plen_38_part_00
MRESEGKAMVLVRRAETNKKSLKGTHQAPKVRKIEQK